VSEKIKALITEFEKWLGAETAAPITGKLIEALEEFEMLKAKMSEFAKAQL
jgi:hypothetical protein